MATKAPTKGQLRRDKVLLALREKPDQTWQDLSEVNSFMWQLEKDGWVKISGKRKQEGKGRASNTYRLTTKGSKLASALSKRA